MWLVTGSSQNVLASCAAMASTSAAVARRTAATPAAAAGVGLYWQGRLGNHDGVDGGIVPGHAPPGEPVACAWPSATRSGSSRNPT